MIPVGSVGTGRACLVRCGKLMVVGGLLDWYG